MRAWEIMEHQNTRGEPLTLRALNQQKLVHAKTLNDKARHASLVQIMYADSTWEQEQLELERLRLELERMKAEIAATQAETEAESSMALTANAKSGITAMEKSHDQITKLAKKGLGRRKKA